MADHVSPNELFAAARTEMLDGRFPVTLEDKFRIMNFFAANIASDVAEAACLLLNKLYDELDLPESDVREIVAFQLESRGVR